jgi:hypothetical protein
MTSTPSQRPFRHIHFIFLIAAVVLVAYSSTLRFQFVYDDASQILHNQWLKSWRYIPDYFTRDVWSFNRGVGSPTNYYRPIFLSWLALNYAAFGLHPLWWHLSSVLSHVGITMLVYLLAVNLVQDRITAAGSALIFGLHPVHIEAVAWVSAVNELLMAMLFIASFLCYLKSETAAEAQQADAMRTRRLWTIGSLVLYTLALLSKETTIVLPGLILVYGLTCGPERFSRLRHQSRVSRGMRSLRNTVPYLAIAAVYLVVRKEAISGLRHTLTPLSTSTIVLTWPSLVWFYLKQLFWPVRLSAFYDTPYVLTPGVRSFILPTLAVAVSCAVVGLIITKWLPERLRARVIFSLAWLVLPMLPLIDLRVFQAGELVHDRYLYLPSVGFSIVIALLLRQVRTGNPETGALALAQTTIAIFIVCLLGAGTALQTQPWSSDLLLYYRGIEVAPNNVLAKNNLAVEMSKRGFYQEGIVLFSQVLQDDPDNWRALANIGYSYFRLGRLDDAGKYLSRSIEVFPENASPYLSLALLRQDQGKLDEAVSLLKKAVAIKPNGEGLHEALGNVLKQQGDLASAAREFSLELAMYPDRTSASDQLAATNVLLRK